MPSPYATQKTYRTTLCSECEILEERLNEATDSVVEVVDSHLVPDDEKSQQLGKALDAREQVLRAYLDHLDDHRHATAA